jgi:hypothetical protein
MSRIPTRGSSATERHLSENVVRPLRTHQRDRLKHIEHRNDGDDHHRQLSDLHGILCPKALPTDSAVTRAATP